MKDKDSFGRYRRILFLMISSQSKHDTSKSCDRKPGHRKNNHHQLQFFFVELQNKNLFQVQAKTLQDDSSRRFLNQSHLQLLCLLIQGIHRQMATL